MSSPTLNTLTATATGRKRTIDPDDVDPIDEICVRLIRNDPALTILNLNHAGIGNRGAIRLSHALQNNSTVVVLFLDNNDISAKGFQFLSNTIATHTSLRMVYLSYNAIGNVGVSHLASAFQRRKKQHRDGTNRCRLEVLKLSYNSIGSLGAKELMQNLPESTHTLTLDGNCISNDGINSIADCLLSNNGLRRLDLRYNRILSEEQCLQSINNVLRSNNVTLKELKLDENNWNDREDETVRLLKNEMYHYLRLNGIGRYSFGSTTIPQALWARVLGKATHSSGGRWLPLKECTVQKTVSSTFNGLIQEKNDNVKQSIGTCDVDGDYRKLGSPDILFELLQTRPDLLLPYDAS